MSGPRAESSRVLRPASRISSSERSGEVYRGSKYMKPLISLRSAALGLIKACQMIYKDLICLSIEYKSS